MKKYLFLLIFSCFLFIGCKSNSESFYQNHDYSQKPTDEEVNEYKKHNSFEENYIWEIFSN